MAMQTLLNKMSGGKRKKRIHVDEIRPNPLNHYEVNDIEELAYLIQRDGQMENGTVYFDESLNDGKSYSLVGGHRRYLAILMNYENEVGDGYMDVYEIDKPVDPFEEKLMIISDNVQRTKTTDERKWEISSAEEKWNHLVEMGKKPSMLKRDWIAREIGMKGRQVQEYLTGKFSEQEEEVKEEKKKEKEEKVPTLKDVSKDIKKIIKNLHTMGEKATIAGRPDLQGEAILIVKNLEVLLEKANADS